MNLLVTGAFDLDEEKLNTLKQLNHNVVFMQQEKDPLPCKPEWVEGIIGNGIFLSHKIEDFTSLRYIQLTSAGFDRVPMDYVKEHKINIFNARGVYSAPMAEFALTGVLNLYKNCAFFAENQKEHKWEKKRDLKELSGKNVCIIGCGSVGNECAKRFKAFDCYVAGVDIKPYKSEFYNTMLSLENINNSLKNADIIVLTLPLTKQTKHLINSERFKFIKKDAVLVNIARGAVIDTAALLTALKRGDIGGAVLDTFEEEPLKTKSPLWDFKNVIITPHNSFVGLGNTNRLWNLILENLKKSEKQH